MITKNSVVKIQNLFVNSNHDLLSRTLGTEMLVFEKNCLGTKWMIPISINRLNYYPEILFRSMDQLFNPEMVISSADSIYNINQ